MDKTIKVLKKTIFSFLFILQSINLLAQVNTDSLWAVWIDESKEDSLRLKAFDSYIEIAFVNTQNDSAFHYAQLQLDFANERGLKEGSIEAPLEKLDGDKDMCVSDRKKAKYALTHYKVKKYVGDYSLVEVQIVTGRTHQIRVHFASIGHPVCGDEM